jgi:SAM-dependent methyltransferase
MDVRTKTAFAHLNLTVDTRPRDRWLVRAAGSKGKCSRGRDGQPRNASGAGDQVPGPGLSQCKLDAIDEVDHIWVGASLTAAVGKEDPFDYVVAAHVIEHSVDLIGFLQDSRALLRPGGRLALVIPNKRFS